MDENANKSDVPKNGTDNDQGDPFDTFTSNEMGDAIVITKALLDAEVARFAETVGGYVQELYSQGGNKAVKC